MASFINLIIVPLLLLSVIYLLIAFFSLLRVKSVYHTQNQRLLSISFYLSIFAHSFFRACSSFYVSYYFMQIYSSDIPLDQIQFTKTLLNILYIPDLLFFISFSILYWKLLYLFYQGHINKNNSPEQLFVYDPSSVYYIMILIFMWSSLSVLFVTAFNVEIISQKVLLIVFIVNNLLLPVILMVTELILHIKFSGMVYLSNISASLKSKVNRALLLWSFGRLVQASIDIYFVSSDDNIYTKYIHYEAESLKVIWGVFLFVAEKVLTEILPFLLVIDLEFAIVFFSPEQPQGQLTNAGEQIRSLDLEVNLILSQERIIEAEQIFRSTREESVFAASFKLEPSLAVLDSDFRPEAKPKNGLGHLRPGFYSNERVMIRSFQNLKLTKYILEEINKELGAASSSYSIVIDRIVNIKGYYLQDDKLHIVEEFCEGGALGARIRKERLTQQRKIEIALQIAKIMTMLHSIKEFAGHGHLHPGNILFTKDLRIKISGLYFLPLKKYCEIMIGYTNKSAYTAPEYLSDARKIILSPRKPGDVYSFGMLLYEIFSETAPFEGALLKVIKGYVVDENIRPKIPATVKESLAYLIRSCWQETEAKRPSFAKISEYLEAVSQNTLNFSNKML